MKTKYKHLRFKDMSLGRPERKGLIYFCYHIESGKLLGWIEQYIDLKEYRFTGNNDEDIFFSFKELMELLDFLKRQNKKFKRRRTK